MSFISYAQNLEDVMLYRALKHVKRGFYIDVGAFHPINDSITKSFYDRGWRGINIEPITEFFELFQQHRPEDININLAVGNYEGEVIFYEVVNTGLSTTNKAYANRHARAGYEMRPHTIRCTTLDSICSENDVGIVHILKIDIEGGEKALLEGFAFATVRPWVVVIESVEPNTMVDSSHEWEPLILGKSYEFVYSDGVSRFYLAAEHSDLQSHFCYPPNAFDDYIIYPHWLALHELSEERDKVERINSNLQALEIQLSRLKNQLSQIQSSIIIRILGRYQTLVDRILRSGTRRRRFYELGLRGIKVILNEGWGSFFTKSWSRLRRWFWLRRLPPFDARYARTYGDIPSHANLIDVIRSKAKRESVIYDIGAFSGAYSIYLAHKVEQSRVYSFEPTPQIFNELIKNIEAFGAKNITAMNIAISDHIGRQHFYVSSDFARSSFYLSNAAWENREITQSIEVNCETIDHLVESGRLPPPDIIKIDVEGHEYEVVRGAEKTISRFMPMIFYEPHGTPEVATSEIETRSLLSKYGYEFTSLGYPIWCHRKLANRQPKWTRK